LSHHPSQIRTATPEQGQDTAAVLTELGLAVTRLGEAVGVDEQEVVDLDGDFAAVVRRFWVEEEQWTRGAQREHVAVVPEPGDRVALSEWTIEVTAVAHHAIQAEYEMSQTKGFTGVMTRFAMINPHCRWFFEETKADGTCQSAAGLQPAIPRIRRNHLFQGEDTRKWRT